MPEIESIKEIKERIEIQAKRLHLDAEKLMKEYGVTSALADILEKQK